MGRKKKINIEDVGQISNIKKSESFIDSIRIKDNNITSSIPEFNRESEDKANIKKWEKLIVKTYFQKLANTEEVYEKLREKYNEEQEVKTIITEMKSKLRDLELLVKKQWHILKKFNLQEKIYREESKNLTDTEKEKTQEIYKDALDKLTAGHVSGFEPAAIIKTKIYNKIQLKYKITNENMEQLKKILRDSKYSEEEDNLINQRYTNQINVLDKFIKSMTQSSPNNSFIKDFTSKSAFLQIKQELKRYEKELEIKAGKGTTDDNLTIKPDSLFIKKPDELKRLTNIESIAYEEQAEYNENIKIEIFKKSPAKEDTTIKIKDMLLNTERNYIENFKEGVIEQLKENAIIHRDMINETIRHTSSIYKSKILNDLYMKVTMFNKLSDMELQILLYLSHVVVKDLVQAKINNRNYEGFINPEELLDFLNKFKIELQNTGLFADSRTANLSENTFTINPNASVYSYQQSFYSDSKDDV